MKNHFLIDNFADKTEFLQQGQEFCILQPSVIVSSFDENIYPQFETILEGLTDNIPPSVVNTFIDFGRKTPVSYNKEYNHVFQVENSNKFELVDN